MVLDGPRPVAHVAKEVGIHDTTLGNWVAAYKRRHGGNAPEPSRDKGDLERENRKLREEVAFLKKAAAFFASENR
jgi:transposase